jgi:Zinc-binding dehydrogenase
MELRQKVWPLIEAKKIRPAVFKVFPLAEAAGAHALMESGAHIGKIVLEVSDSRKDEDQEEGMGKQARGQEAKFWAIMRAAEPGKRSLK